MASVNMKISSSNLSNKIRVVASPKKQQKCPEHHQQFYSDYASTVSATLKKPMFQKFLHWLLKTEEITKHDVTDIQVRVFPLQKENGNSLAGRCNHKGGVIHIFPKKRSYVKEKFENNKKEKVRFYLKSRAMATLIHEILHFRYKGNEKKVRKLTKKYFSIFIRHKKSDFPHWHEVVQKMLSNF